MRPCWHHRGPHASPSDFVPVGVDDLQNSTQFGLCGGGFERHVETVALLNRARAAIADEIASSLQLPNDLDTQIWGYFDEVEKQRADAVARARQSPGPEQGSTEQPKSALGSARWPDDEATRGWPDDEATREWPRMMMALAYASILYFFIH